MHASYAAKNSFARTSKASVEDQIIMEIRQQQVSPEDALAAVEQSNTTFSNFKHVYKYLYFAHQMCPLSIVDLWFFRNVLLRSISQFSLNSFTRFHFPVLLACCTVQRTCVPKSLNSC